DDRLQLRQWALGEPLFIRRSIENGHFDEMLKMVKGQADGNRGALYAAIAGEPNTLDFLRKSNRLEWIYNQLAEEKSPDDSANYLRVLVANSSLVSAVFLVDKGDELIAYVKRLEDKILRASVWPTLVRHHLVLNRIAENQQWDELVNFAKDETDDAVRQTYLR